MLRAVMLGFAVVGIAAIEIVATVDVEAAVPAYEIMTVSALAP